jgi:putative transposase
MVVKYRRRVIDDDISSRLRQIFESIGRDYKITVTAWNHDTDHVHVLFSAEPKSELSKFINAYKSASSRLIKKEYLGICDLLWKDAFWSKSFCLLTTGGVTADIIEQYILSQGER